MAFQVNFSWTNQGDRVEFTATASGGTPVLWHWDFGDGETQTVDTPTVVHWYEQPPNGNFFVVRLRGEDASGRFSEPAIVSVTSPWRPKQCGLVQWPGGLLIEAVEVPHPYRTDSQSVEVAYYRVGGGREVVATVHDFGCPTLQLRESGLWMLGNSFGTNRFYSKWSFDGGRTWSSGGFMYEVWISDSVKWATNLQLDWGAEASIAVWREDDFITLRFKRSPSSGAHYPPDSEATIITILERAEAFQLRQLEDGALLVTNCKDLHFRCDRDGTDPSHWVAL